MRAYVFIAITSIFYFVVLAGCKGCEAPSLSDEPECAQHPRAEQCIKYFTQSRTTCINTYGSDAIKFCPSFFARNLEECIENFSLEQMKYMCPNALQSTPESCKKYYPTNYKQICPQFFLATKEDCIEAFGLCGSFYDTHCRNFYKNSMTECKSMVAQCYHNEKERYYYMCSLSKIANKEDCIATYGDKATSRCPEFYTTSKVLCQATYKDAAPTYCPQYFMGSKTECENAFGAFEAPDMCPQFFTRTKQECIDTYGEFNAKYHCPQFF